jgi:hypothetical protein
MRKIAVELKARGPLSEEEWIDDAFEDSQVNCHLRNAVSRTDMAV